MNNSVILSNATNFSSNINSGVDVRTGMYSISVSLGKFIANKSSGNTIVFQLSYDASSPIDIGFGRGWALPFSRFNKENNCLILTTGQSFLLEWNDEINEFVIPYRKLKDIRVLYLDDTKELKVLHKDGRSEFLDWQDGTLNRTVSASGLGIYYEYGIFNSQQVLWRVYDETGREIIIDWWTDEWITTVKHNLYGETYQKTTIEKTGGGGFKRLSSISFPELTDPMFFRYRYIKESGYDVIEEVTHVSGLIEKMEYLDNGHRLPKGAPLTSVPYIMSHILHLGEGQPPKCATYQYSDKNYLGFASDKAWVPGEDTLFKAEKDYRYFTWESINGNKVVEREYNKYHLMEGVKYYEDGSLYKEESYVYFANLEGGIESQPATYSLLKEQTTMFYHLSESRDFIQLYEYDDYGNVTLEQAADGSKIVRTFYPASGVDGACPKAPTGMVSFLKQECFVPNSSLHSDPPRKETMTYKSLKNMDGGYFVVLSSLVDENGSKFIDYYDDPSKPLTHGRIRTEKTSIGEYENSVRYDYLFTAKGLKTETTLFTHDGLESTESETLDYFFYLPIESIDSEGVIGRCSYDPLGRLTQETLAPDTEFAVADTFGYRVGDGVNAITKTDVKGNVTVTRMNNAGKVISVQIATPEKSLFTIQQCEYDEYGLMISQIDTDWLDGVPNNVTTKFTHDVYGNIETITHQDGRCEVIDQNPVSLCTTYTQVGLLSEITEYNLSGQEVDKVSRDGSGTLLARTKYAYDGYGNLLTLEDTAGRTTKFRYDGFNRLIETERFINGEIVIESFSYPAFSDSSKASNIAVNGIELGRRNFDGLLRVTSQKISDSVTAFSYQGVASRPTCILMPDGSMADITNNIYLNVPESIALRSQRSLSQTYQYDKQSAQLIGYLNQGCKAVFTRDNFGRVLTEEVELNDGIVRQSNFRYSLLGKLLEQTDFFGNKVAYEYDDLGRVKAISSIVVDSETNTVIEYDEYSRPWRYVTKQCEDEAAIELSYNAVGLETSRVATFNGLKAFSIEQFYNISLLLERRVCDDERGKSTEVFNYDDLNRLAEYYSDGLNSPQDSYANTIKKQEFTYDVYNNITHVVSCFSDTTRNVTTYIYNPLNPVRLEAVTNTHPTYPREVQFEYDEAGNSLNDEQGRAYRYNAFNQVLSVDTPNGRELARYQYDAAGQVVSQTIEDCLMYLFYSRGHLINEYSEGVHSSYHHAAPGLIGRTVSSDDETQHQLLLGNSQGSIIETLSSSDKDPKRKKETRCYTPYGEG